MMKKKTSSTKRIILITLLVLLILVILSIIVLKREKETETLTNYLNEYSFIIDDTKWNDGTLYPENMQLLKRSYYGTVDIRSIGKSIDFVVNKDIPNLKATLAGKPSEEIKEYFNKNKKGIILVYGIQTPEAFETFVGKIKDLSATKLELESYKIDPDTIKVLDKETTVDLHVTYKNCEELILKVKITAKKYQTQPSILYSFSFFGDTSKKMNFGDDV
ncbi:MAG: hypothetical protein IJ867_03605 [Clostridia bacterium]|nr:hypothetical protein [Clostridia bacterium]